ncbi:MAG: HEAT repeat domain-containing protein [Kovacikia sp.]
MYDDDELTLLDIEADLESPLDRMDPVDTESEESKPDPEEMLLLLESKETNQRMLAARAFCELQDNRAIPHLIRLLSDPCPLVRVSAAYALGRNPSIDAVEPLIQRYDRDWNGYVRKGVVWALGNCHDIRTLETLIEALKTDISAVRLWAASSLAQMAAVGYESVIAAIPPLIEAMRQDPVAAVRSNCAWSIGQLCRELPSNVVYATAIDALIETFVEDDELGVREDARSAMLKLGDPRGLQLIEDLEREGFL